MPGAVRCSSSNKHTLIASLALGCHAGPGTSQQPHGGDEPSDGIVRLALAGPRTHEDHTGH